MARLFALQELALPKAGGPLGLQLDQSTHEITSVVPGSVAQRHGVTKGDVIVGVDNMTLTNFEYMRGPLEDTVVVNATAAIMDATAAMSKVDPSQEYCTLRILKPVAPPDAATIPPSTATENTAADFIASPSFAGPRPGFVYRCGHNGNGYYRDVSPSPTDTAAAAKVTTQAAPLQPLQKQSGTYDARLPTIKGQRQPLQPQQSQPRQPSPPQFQAPLRAPAPPRTQQDEALALAMYPWATKFQDAQGQVKNRYNMPDGAVLQPMIALQDQRLETLRRKEAFATLRPGTSSFSASLQR